MFFTKHKLLIRWIIIIASFAITSLILWNTYVFFQKFKAEERSKMSIWTLAFKEVNSVDNLNINLGELPLEILRSNTTSPTIVIDKDYNIIASNNIDEKDLKDIAAIKKLIKALELENKPIKITYKDNISQTLYYGNSPILKKLKYYPLALVLIILLFATVVYLFYKTNKNAVQNKLWTGMAKETAHQIGTPLSSLIGWTEILKTEDVNPEYITEIEKDIHRLQTITERFSKIGSLPVLEKCNIVEETQTSFDYLKTRLSKLVNYNIILPEQPIYVNLNKQLFSWSIENLVKNAIDAMKGKGELTIEMLNDRQTVKINIIDSGKGISKSNFNTIFEPGYTSKKRGWGLGLSLTKRIIEDFHNGKIKVKKSEIGKGTTIQIVLKTL